MWPAASTVSAPPSYPPRCYWVNDARLSPPEGAAGPPESNPVDPPHPNTYVGLLIDESVGSFSSLPNNSNGGVHLDAATNSKAQTNATLNSRRINDEGDSKAGNETTLNFECDQSTGIHEPRWIPRRKHSSRHQVRQKFSIAFRFFRFGQPANDEGH
jgi:hypothetical protein